MKFCRRTLFETGRALFMNNWKTYSRKTSRVLTVKEAALEEQVTDKAILSASQNRREVSCWWRCTACNSLHLHEENQLQFSKSKHFRFYSTKKHLISEWYFPKNHEIGSLVVEKVKKSWAWTSLGSRRAIERLRFTFATDDKRQTWVENFSE